MMHAREGSGNPPAGLPSGAAARAPRGAAEAAALLPFGLLPARPSQRQASGPIYGSFALGALVAGCVVLAVLASTAPSAVVTASREWFPGWIAGPLHPLGTLLSARLGFARWGAQTARVVLSVLIAVMLIAYLVVLAFARTLSMRTIAAALIGICAVMVLSPPVELSDLYNYLGFARLGALHGLNPYTHVIADARHDQIYRLVSWRHLSSPYGEVFTLLTYPLARLPLPTAYWVLKVLIGLADVGLGALVWACARRLGRDPRFVVLFVAANPLVLIFELGGFHNDAFMLLPAMAAIALLVARRYRWAGGLLLLGVAVKFTVILLLPFLVIAARPARRSLQVLIGAVLAAVPLAAVSVAAFGFAPPNLADQSAIVTPYSILNLLGVALGIGGATPGFEEIGRLACVIVVAAIVAVTAARRRPDWLSGAGWATLALLASMAWLMPWYVLWALPLAALGSGVRLRRATLALTVFAALTFMPAVTDALTRAGVNTMSSPADRAATQYLARLQH